MMMIMAPALYNYPFCFVAVVSVDEQPVHLQLCDTAGQVRDRNIIIFHLESKEGYKGFI